MTIMLEQQLHIDLHLPTGWNRCTTEELEIIAAAIVREQASVGRYRPFLWERIKVHIVLGINDITILQNNTPEDDGKWLVKRTEDKEPWQLSTGQIANLCEHLNWLTDENASPLFVFPYPILRLEVRGERFLDKQSGKAEREVSGPPPLLDGYTWREYRWLSDWMQAYMRHANAMAQSKMEDARRKNQEGAENARNEFLAILFKPAGEKMFNVQCSMFNGFSPVKWQVILFWWSSLMRQLAKKFPRVFKNQPVKKGRRTQSPDTPWDFYNHVTATIQKYIGGLSASDVDDQPYGVVLQQLEMMADEAAELERAKSKHH